MELLTLGLGVNLDGASLFQNRKADDAFLSLQSKVWSRDDYTCRFCGFTAKQYQEVVNINGNYRDNKLNNLATACIFCAHTQLLGLRNNSKIIYFPNISQVDLNHFMRVLFCCTHFGEEYAETAKTLVQALKLRSQTIENVFGADCSDSVLFAQTFIDAVDQTKKDSITQNILPQLRWYPNRGDYEEVISYWAEQVLTREQIEQRLHHGDH
ncbi:MAG: type IVB secretion system protein IcmJDotN [Gammaproteobacteria bacterium]